jgi:hypothetical protein
MRFTMEDDVVRLTSIYVAPTGSPVPSPTPNSEDAPATTIDLFITGEEGDNIQSDDIKYQLSYYAMDFGTGNLAVGAFNGLLNQSTGDANWLPYKAGEDFFTNQKITITIPGSLRFHVLQYYAVLVAKNGDIVSFVQSEPFVLV